MTLHHQKMGKSLKIRRHGAKSTTHFSNQLKTGYDPKSKWGLVDGLKYAGDARRIWGGFSGMLGYDGGEYSEIMSKLLKSVI